MKHYIKELQRHIVESEWDEWIIENDRYMTRVCLAIVIVAVLYFGIIAITRLLQTG